MNKEEAIVILYTLKNGTATTYYMDNFAKCDEAIDVILNLIQKQDKEISKLRKKNNDLLSKLRNRIKQVNKLTKYSAYKKEFSNLNKRIEKQDKIIDKMAEQLEKCKDEIDGLAEGNIDCFIPREYSDINDCIKKKSCKECIIEYFKKEVENENTN